MKKILTIAIMLALGQMVLGQGHRNRNIITEINQLGTWSPVNLQGYQDKFTKVKGSPFLFESWAEAEIIFNNGHSYSEGIRVNVDLEENVIYLMFAEKIFKLQLDAVREIHRLQEGSQSQKFINMPAVRLGESSENHVLLEELYDGEIALYKRPQKLFWPAPKVDPFGTDKDYDEYKDKEEYYLLDSRDQFLEVKPKARSFRKALPRYNQKIRKYFRTSESTDIATEEGMIALLRWLDG